MPQKKETPKKEETPQQNKVLQFFLKMETPLKKQKHFQKRTGTPQ